MQLHVRRGSYRCQHLFSSHTMFTLRMVALVDEAERRLLSEAGWWGEDLYQSQRLLDLQEQRTALAAVPIRPEDPERFWQMSPFEQWVVKQAKLAVNQSRINRAHRITVSDLVDGVSLESADLKELGQTEAIIVEACTALDRWLGVGEGYDGRASVITLPRTQAKLQRMRVGPS